MLGILATAPPMVAKRWAADNGASAPLLDVPPARPDGKSRISRARWIDPSLINSVRELVQRQRTDPRERALLDSEVVGIADADTTGVNVTRKVTLDGGATGFFKPFSGIDTEIAEDYGQPRPVQPIHEVATWQFARELGPQYADLVPPCVVRKVDGEYGSMAYGVEGKEGPPVGISGDVVGRAGFFDALIGQQDRHSDNLLTGEKMHLIDHGFAFGVEDDMPNAGALQQARRRAEPGLRDDERLTLRRVLDSPTTLGLAGVLEQARVNAVRDRARRMLETGEILEFGELGGDGVNHRRRWL